MNGIKREIKEFHAIPPGEEHLHQPYNGMTCSCDPVVFPLGNNCFYVIHRSYKMNEVSDHSELHIYSAN